MHNSWKLTFVLSCLGYMICDHEKAIGVETSERNAEVLDGIDANLTAHSNHSLLPNAPVTFKMDASSGGGSYGFTHQRLELARKALSRQAEGAGVDGLRTLKNICPVPVNPGQLTGPTLMSLTVKNQVTGFDTSGLSFAPRIPQNVMACVCASEIISAARLDP